MELKSEDLPKLAYEIYSSNRTFMELKWKYEQLGSVLNLF